MFTKSDVHYFIGSDFASSLKLYSLPENFAQEISNHSNVNKLLVTAALDDLSDSGCQIFFGHRITTSHVVKMSNLKWIHLGTSGYDKIDLSLCRERGIVVTNSSTLIAESLATHALSFVLSLMRNSYFNLTINDSEDFTREAFDFNFQRLKTPQTSKALIFGSGNASIALAAWLAGLGFQIGVVSVSKRRIENLPPGVSQIEAREADDVLGAQDFVINLLPQRDDTVNYFDEKRFTKMGSNSYYISVGRGGTTNEQDLINSLRQRRIAGAGLDVFSNEPLDSNSPFFECKNVIMTPHVAAVNRDYWPVQVAFFLKNLENFALGQKMRNVLEAQ